MAARNTNRARKRKAHSKAPKISKAPTKASISIQQTIQTAVQYHQAGQLEQAENIYLQVLKLEPNNVDANHMLGVIAYQLGKYNAAIFLIQKAIKAKPSLADAYCNLGVVLKEAGQLDKAIDNYKKAISLKPNYAYAYHNYGNALAAHGQIDEAINSYRRAIDFKPNYVEAHRSLSRKKRWVRHDEDFEKMLRLYEQKNLSDNQKMQLAFGLGNAYEELKDYGNAFNTILEGNRLNRSSYMYSIANEKNYFAKIKNIFSINFFTSHTNMGCPDKTPIFILGMPRSGTTLVEQILASHPQVFGAGELNVLIDLVKNLSPVHTSNRFPDCILDLDSDTFTNLGTKYIDQIRKYSPTATHITDKMPANFLRIGLIKAILPNAKIIHCRRDPMDNCWSIFKNYLPEIKGYAYNLTELGQYYILYQDLMRHWHAMIPGFIYDIKYEDVVSDQEKQTKKLLKFCGLPWNKDCLNFHKTKRSISTASNTQVRRPIYNDSVNLWKRYEDQLNPLKKVLTGC